MANPEPLSGMAVPRFAAPASFMRLPLRESAEGLDIAIAGLPFDSAVTNRPGARHGPRALRDASTLMRRVHPVSGIAPYELCRVADVGDAPVNPVDIADSLQRTEAFFRAVHAAGARPLVAGGDHLGSLPVLRAIARGRPLGMVHFDSHSDTNDSYFGGFTLTHGTPFRRAIDEGLLDSRRIIQIGLRGSMYERDDHAWAKQAGIRVVTIEEAVDLGPDAVAAEARRVVGEAPCYLSFDIDCLDPAYAPGTGTPEVGGFTTREAQRMLRGLEGIGIAGADVVEVSPPFDHQGITAMAGATMMFEILCLMAARAP
jgi:guanidinopropionase